MNIETSLYKHCMILLVAYIYNFRDGLLKYKCVIHPIQFQYISGYTPKGSKRCPFLWICLQKLLIEILLKLGSISYKYNIAYVT